MIGFVGISSGMLSSFSRGSLMLFCYSLLM